MRSGRLFLCALLVTAAPASPVTGETARISTAAASVPDIVGDVYESVVLDQEEAERIFAIAEAALYLKDLGLVRWFETGPHPASPASSRRCLRASTTLEGFQENLERDLGDAHSGRLGQFLSKRPGVSSVLPGKGAGPVAGPSALAAAPGVVFSDSFEDGRMASWQLANNVNGDYDFAGTGCSSRTGTWSADAVRGGYRGQYLFCWDAYPSTVVTQITHSGCDGAQGAAQAWLDFYLTSEMTTDDSIGVYYPGGDGYIYGYVFSGTWSPGWFHAAANMKQWNHVGDLTAQSCTQAIFQFKSAATAPGGTGARIDDVSIRTDAPPFLHAAIDAAPTSGPSPLAVSFSASVLGGFGGETYQWLFGDGSGSTPDSTATTKTASFTYSTAGTYWVRLRVVDGTGARAYAHVKITPVSGPSCSLTCSASVPGSTTVGSPVAFQATATPASCTASATYDWTFGDAQTSNAQNPSHAYTSPGTKTWTMTASVSGAPSCTQQGTIIVNAGGTGIPGDCDGDGHVTTGEVQRAVDMLLLVEPPGCSVDANGDGRVTADEAQRVINAYLADVTPVGTTCDFACSANVPAFALAGTAVAFSSAVTNANCPGTLTHSWVFGDGRASALPSPSLSYSASGTYTWSLTVQQGASRCARSGTILVGGVGTGGVSVSPATAALHPYGTQTFTASVPGDPSAEIVWTVQEGWGLTGGLVTQNGEYTTPPRPGTYHVVAVNRKNPAQWGSATVTSTDSIAVGETKSGVVGPSGGTVALSNGIVLVVPSGAAAAGVTATLSLITNDPLFADSLHTVVGLSFSGAVTAARLEVPVASDAVADRYAGAFYDPVNPVFANLTPTVSGSKVSLDLAAAITSSASTTTRQAGAGVLAGVVPLAGHIAVEKGVADPAGSTGPPIAMPYMEQGDAVGPCWAAALHMLHRGYEKDPGVYNSVPSIMAFFGVSKNDGVDSDAIRYLLNGARFAKQAGIVTGRTLSSGQINFSFYNFVAYVREQTKAGKPVLANLVYHAGLFLGYEESGGKKYLYYHDPANAVQGEAVAGYRRFPYTRVDIEDLRREFFVRSWTDHVAFNSMQSWVPDIPPPSPSLQTFGFRDSEPNASARYFNGIGFEIPDSAGRLEMRDYVRWDHTQRDGYSHLVPEVLPAVKNIVIKDIPVFNMDRSQEAKVKVKVRVVSYDGGSWKNPPLWQTELGMTLPVFPVSDPASARKSYSVIIPFEELSAKILPADKRLSLVFELFDGQGTRLEHFNTDFTLGGPFISSIAPDPAETNGLATLEGFGFGGPENKVMFTADGGTIAATSVVSWSDTKASVLVPVGAKTGPVVVTGGTTSSNAVPLAVEGIWNPDARADVSFYVTRLVGTSKQACQNFNIQIFRNGSPADSGSSVARNGLFDTTLKIGSGYTYVIEATYTSPPETKRIYGSVVVLDTLNFFEVSTSTSTASVSVTPSSVTLPLGGTKTFAASVTAAGTQTGVTWSVKESGGGTVTALDSNQGVYKAPAVPGTYHVVAAAVADPARPAEATVTVTNVVKVTLTPTGGSLVPGGSIAFTATVTGASNTGVTWSSSGGSLVPESDVKATFTAPAGAGTYTITATAKADPSKKATAKVEVVADATKTLSFGGTATVSMRLGSIGIPVVYQTSGSVTAAVVVGGSGLAIVPSWAGGAATGGVFGGLVLTGCGTGSGGIRISGAYTATPSGVVYRDYGESSDPVYTEFTVKRVHYETCRTTDQLIGSSGQNAGWKMECVESANLDATVSCGDGAGVVSQALGDVEEVHYRKSDNGEVSRIQYTVYLQGPGITIGR